MLNLGLGLAQGGFYKAALQQGGGPENVYQEGDAADPNNETNTRSANWTTNANGNIVSASDPHDGAYSLELTRTTAGTFELGIPLTVENGATYDVTLYVKRTAGDNNLTVYLRSFNGWTAEQSQVTTSTTYTLISLTGTTNAITANITFKQNNSSAVGTKWQIDNIVVTKQ